MGTLVCITGGAGYIGRCFTSHLLSSGVKPSDISVIDSMSSRTSRRPPKGVYFLHADICDRDSLSRWLSNMKPAVVVNLAGLADVLESEQRVHDYLRVNVFGVQSVVETMCGCLPEFRLIQASSCAAHNSGQLLPKSWYGQTKAFTEDYLKRVPNSVSFKSSLGAEHGRILALRLFNVYGAYIPAFGGEVTSAVVRDIGVGDPDIYSTRLMQRLALSASAAKTQVTIRNDYVRDYVHIEDVCRALTSAVVECVRGTLSEPFQAIDIGTGRGRSTTWIAKHWLRYANATPCYEVSPEQGINDEIRSPESRSAIANIDAAKRVLHWRPRVPISRGIRTLQMYMDHVARTGGTT